MLCAATYSWTVGQLDSWTVSWTPGNLMKPCARKNMTGSLGLMERSRLVVSGASLPIRGLMTWRCGVSIGSIGSYNSWLNVNPESIPPRGLFNWRVTTEIVTTIRIVTTIIRIPISTSRPFWQGHRQLHRVYATTHSGRECESHLPCRVLSDALPYLPSWMS